MVKCTNCGKELKWYQISYPMMSSKPFCSGLKCYREYKKKKKAGLIKEKPEYKEKKIFVKDWVNYSDVVKQEVKTSHLSLEEREEKEKLLKELKKRQMERGLEIKVGKKRTKDDDLLQKKIWQLEGELKRTSAGELTYAGLMFSVGATGVFILGCILTVTGIGAIVGIPMVIISFIICSLGIVMLSIGLIWKLFEK